MAFYLHNNNDPLIICWNKVYHITQHICKFLSGMLDRIYLLCIYKRTCVSVYVGPICHDKLRPLKRWKNSQQEKKGSDPQIN